jgi:hypothetical protein
MTKKDLVPVRRDVMRVIGFAILLVSAIARAGLSVEAQSGPGWILWEKNFTMKAAREP